MKIIEQESEYFLKRENKYSVTESLGLISDNYYIKHSKNNIRYQSFPI